MAANIAAFSGGNGGTSRLRAMICTELHDFLYAAAMGCQRGRKDQLARSAKPTRRAGSFGQFTSLQRFTALVAHFLPGRAEGCEVVLLPGYWKRSLALCGTLLAPVPIELGDVLSTMPRQETAAAPVPEQK
jgi:hypothetical protein